MSSEVATAERLQTEAQSDPTNGGWNGRPFAAFLVRALVFITPLAAAVGVSYGLASMWPRPPGLAPTLTRWAVLVIVSTITMIAVDRVARRFLPLAALLRMTLVFPDEAPSRYGVALRSGTIKQLERRVDQIRRAGAEANEAEAAELLLELAAALSQHDRFTRGHGERVRAYSALIGAEMGLSELEQSKLQWAGLIHDVGKLAVPTEILNKTTALTDEEYEIIKTHPAEGMALVEPLAGWLGDWVLGVGEHHERWDGAGYPNGLAGEQISLAGRIVAVADVFDVITAARSYKKPQSPVLARQELADNAGSQFDERVVRAFLNISLGRLRVTMWPLSWLADFPLIGPAFTAPASGMVATGTLAVMSAVSGGVLTEDPRPPEMLAAVAEELPPATTPAATATAPSTTFQPSTDDAVLVEPHDWNIDPASSTSTTDGGTAASTTTATTPETTNQPGSSSTSSAPSTSSPTTSPPNNSTTSTTAATTSTTIVQVASCADAQNGETNLVGADLSYCDLSSMTLPGVDLRQANLTGANLSDSTVTGFNMDDTNLTDLDMTKASFSDGSMVGAQGSDIKGNVVRITRVNMGNSSITDSSFLRSRFEEVSFGFATLDNSSFPQALFIDTNFNDAQTVGTFFTQSEHRNSEFYRTTATDSEFFMATIHDSRLDDGSFVGADFSLATLVNTVITNADIKQVDLTRANLSTASGVPVNFATASYLLTICPGQTQGGSSSCW